MQNNARVKTLSAIGAINPADSHLMVFKLDKSTPRLPSIIVFQILVSFQNINIHHYIVNEEASTCIMSKSIWKKLGSPKLKPSNTKLRADDGFPYAPIGLYPRVLVKLAGKIMLIDMKVLDA